MKILIRNIDIMTVDNAMSIIRNGFIGIENDRIAFVEKDMDDIKLLEFGADEVIDGTGKLAMPGFVNAHTHTPMTILRGYADDMLFNEWLYNRIIPAENKLNADDIRLGAMLGMAEMIRSGTTCFADMYFHMDSIAEVVYEVGIRANLSGIPAKRNGGGNLDVSVDAYREHLKRLNNSNSLIKGYVFVHSIYAHEENEIRKYIELAQELNTGIHIHISESLFEKKFMQEKYGKSTVQCLNEWGLFDVNTIAAHCVYLEEEDFVILRDKNVNPVHNPSSNLKLANGIADVPKMLDYGINVCLGTDGAASNNNLNIIEELHLAALLHKGEKKDPLVVNAGQAIRMATVNGGKALGFRDEIGVIRKSAKADIVLINTDSLHLTPMPDVPAAIAYSMQGSDIDTVIIDGKIVMYNKRLTTIDEEKLKYEIRRISKDLK